MLFFINNVQADTIAQCSFIKTIHNKLTTEIRLVKWGIIKQIEVKALKHSGMKGSVTSSAEPEARRVGYINNVSEIERLGPCAWFCFVMSLQVIVRHRHGSSKYSCCMNQEYLCWAEITHKIVWENEYEMARPKPLIQLRMCLTVKCRWNAYI